MNNTIKRKSPYGLISLVLGILSILSGFFWYISVPTGVLAVVLGQKGVKTVDSKLALAGKILGIIGLCICGVIFAFFLTILIASNISSIF